MRIRSNIRLVFNSILLISAILCAFVSSGQTGLDSPVKYEARDSIVASVSTEIVKLYGDASVNYDGIQLTADYIEINLRNSEVLATYTLDSIGQPIGKPIFTAEGEESKCDYVKYNFKTKKGYIREVRAQQDEGYIHMAESKIHPNEQIHLRNGKYTTCDLDTPHYHFKMTKAIIVPDERIVTGPVYMKIFKIPTPLAAPFAFFPNSDTKKQGFIPPEFGNAQGGAGFGLKDFGYYIPLGDYWETSFLGSVYTTGQWAAANTTNYLKKYKYNGTFGVRFEQLRGYFYVEDVTNRFSVNWRHSQDPKAHPSMTFSSDINYLSDNNSKNSLDPANPEYFNSQFNSSINLSKRWKAGIFGGSATLKTSLSQNSQSEQYNIDLPSFNFRVSRFKLGDFRKKKIGKKWYDDISVQYSMDAINRIAAPDSIFNEQYFNEVGGYAKNGIKHAATVQSQLKLFGSRITFTPSMVYNEIWNFQYEEFDTLNSSIISDTINGFGSARNISFAGNVAGNFYGLYRLKGKNQTRFKHVAQAGLSFTYRPDIGEHTSLVYTIDSTTYTQRLSPFRNSQYRENAAGNAGVLGFNLTNTLKMKTLNRKDTINESSNTFNLIDVFSISSGYDLLKDSSALSPFALSLRTSKFLKVLTFQTNGTINPYAYNNLGSNFKEYDANGTVTKEYAWENGQGIGRFSKANFIINANFTSKNGRKKQNQIADQVANDAVLTDIVTNPGLSNFDIPWQFNMAYNLSLTANIKDSISEDNYDVIQTTRLFGDFSINDKWMFRYGIDFDLQQFLGKNQTHSEAADRPYLNTITRWNLDITRDLHCWEASLSLGQNGTWKVPYTSNNFVFLFRINIKASMLQDIKLEYKELPFFN